MKLQESIWYSSNYWPFWPSLDHLYNHVLFWGAGCMHHHTSAVLPNTHTHTHTQHIHAHIHTYKLTCICAHTHIYTHSAYDWRTEKMIHLKMLFWLANLFFLWMWLTVAQSCNPHAQSCQLCTTQSRSGLPKKSKYLIDLYTFQVFSPVIYPLNLPLF